MLDRLTTAALLLASIALLYFTVAGKNGLGHLFAVSENIKTLEKKDRELQAEIVKLKNETYAIKENDDVLEAIAREQLGLSKQNDIVYVIKHDSENSSIQRTEKQQ